MYAHLPAQTQTPLTKIIIGRLPCGFLKHAHSKIQVACTYKSLGYQKPQSMVSVYMDEGQKAFVSHTFRHVYKY